MIERISQRQRRQTDYVRPVSQEKSPEVSNRRQTLSGPVTVEPPAPPEPREIPASPENSPTFLQGEEDLFVDSSSHLQPHRGEPAPEKSHSPPMRRQTISIPPNELPSSEEVWNAATKATPHLTANPRRKTPAFVDRQEHARRVSPISLSDPRSAERGKERPPQPQPSRKRQRATDDEDDDEFSRYERAIDPSAKRAQKPDQSRHIKRRRVDDAPRRERISPPPSTAPAATTTTITSAATAAAADSKVRVRWSSEEDKRLMRLIRECGTSWSDLVRQNHAEPVQEGEVRIEDRDQVQFKDRARNLKIIYYRWVSPILRYKCACG